MPRAATGSGLLAGEVGEELDLPVHLVLGQGEGAVSGVDPLGTRAVACALVATDAADAERITRKLFSSPHQVVTGVALVRVCDRLEIVQSDVTTVYPKRLTDRQIHDHVAGGDWQGKAGAYGIQDTGDAFVDHIDGSLTNVMGLPIEVVHSFLDPRV